MIGWMDMADKIGITKSGVDNIVSELQGEQEKITNYMKTLDTELGNVNQAWKGADATKYTEKMQDDYKVLLKEYNDSLQSYIDYLSGVFGEYQKLDEKFAGESIEV